LRITLLEINVSKEVLVKAFEVESFFDADSDIVLDHEVS
jgi:hypothetical protein